MTMTDARKWGGFALGIVFMIVGLSIGVSSSWSWTGVSLIAGGAVIAIGHVVWILSSRRKPHP